MQLPPQAWPRWQTRQHSVRGRQLTEGVGVGAGTHGGGAVRVEAEGGGG
jgi:hypothetical protein